MRILAENTGKWHIWDAGKFRAKGFKCKTVHLEVAPEIADKLNHVLAVRHPNTLVDPNRQKGTERKATKKIKVTQKVVPKAVLGCIDNSSIRKDHDAGGIWFIQGWNELDKHVQKEVRELLESFGGKKGELFEHGLQFLFDYEPYAIRNEILRSHLIPDNKSFQFYATPDVIADYVRSEINAFGYNSESRFLEPSAGLGGLLRVFPKEVKTTAIELAKIRATILRENYAGVEVLNKDFLQFSDSEHFDCIVMNPPFDRGQWQMHLEHALSLLKQGGRLIAVLPPSAVGWAKSQLNSQYSYKFSEPFDNQFDRTNVSVVVLTVDFH